MDSRYKQEVQKYGKIDAIIAICAFVAATLLTIVVWAVRENFKLTGFLRLVERFALPVIVIAIVFAILIVRKESFASIGFHKDKLKQILGLTSFIVVIFTAFGLVPGLVSGAEFINPFAIISVLATTFVLAAFEDIFFVGYLQTRLYGIFKKNVYAIPIGAALFALIHIPQRLLDGFIGFDMIGTLIFLCLMHVFLVLIFRRCFSLIPVIAAHMLNNLYSMGQLWEYYDSDLIETWATIGIFLLVITFVVWEMVQKRRSRVPRTSA